MPPEVIPRRPRLASHVLPRRHVIDEQERVILHDLRRGEVLEIGAREWVVLEAADGTRELEGIVVAARREGVRVRVAAVEGLLGALVERGMVIEGEAPEGEAPGREAPEGEASEGEASREGPGHEPSGEAPVVRPTGAPPPAGDAARSDDAGARPRTVVAVTDEGLRCDGVGTCCRLYGTVMLSAPELRRVQGLLPQWRVGPAPPTRWTTPVRGSEPTPVLATIARDGACGFLQDDSRCAVHRVGGARAKPAGCQLFPRVFVDGGDRVYVSLKPECPCVLDPRGDHPEPLVDPAWSGAAGLPPQVVVDVLPREVPLTPDRRVSREQVRAWSSALGQAPAPGDPAAALWAHARRVAREGLVPMTDAERRAGPPGAAAVVPWIAALGRLATRRAREHAAWRAERDLVRRCTQALATLTLVLAEPEALEEALQLAPPHPDHEARYWIAGLCGYQWLGEEPLVKVLRDRAIRVWLARSLPAVLPGGEAEPDLRAPLALVEAMMRAHGLARYIDEVPGAAEAAAPAEATARDQKL